MLNEDLYRAHRYKLGVGEGPAEHLPEKALPLESNLNLLHGGEETRLTTFNIKTPPVGHRLVFTLCRLKIIYLLLLFYYLE